MTKRLRERTHTKTLNQSVLLALSEVLRSSDGGEMMRLMLATMLQALVDAETAVRVGAGLHERSGARVTQRNETREKVVSTTSGSSLSHAHGRRQLVALLGWEQRPRVSR